CALHLDGAAAVPEADLIKAADTIVGTDYSRAFVDSLAAGTLRREYRKRGYWAAELTQQVAALDRGCTGVTVTIGVEEGASYAWDHAEWTGVAALQQADLDKALAMKAGDVVDIMRIEAGLRGVHAAYEKVGYLMQDTAYTPALDDAARRATFRLAVNE